MRPIGPADHAAVLDLNARHVPAVAPMDAERLDYLLALSARADVVDVGGEVAGFVITMPPGTAYDSLNYGAFSDRYPDRDFSYLDRIVIDAPFQRRGLGGLVYDAAERDAAAYGRLTLEVNTDPPNPTSMAFHLARGFVEVGRRGEPGHEVALLVKDLS